MRHEVIYINRDGARELARTKGIPAPWRLYFLAIANSDANGESRYSEGELPLAADMRPTHLARSIKRAIAQDLLAEGSNPLYLKVPDAFMG